MNPSAFDSIGVFVALFAIMIPLALIEEIWDKQIGRFVCWAIEKIKALFNKPPRY